MQLENFKGTFTGLVKFGDTRLEILFYVKNGEGANLSGMDWIKKTGLDGACISFLKTHVTHETPSFFEVTATRSDSMAPSNVWHPTCTVEIL